MALGGTPIWQNGHLCRCESPNGSEGKERVKPVMLSTDTPTSIVAVPYSTWFTTVITGTSAVGPGDSRFDRGPGDSRHSRESGAGLLTLTQHLHLCEFELGIVAREGSGAFNYNDEGIPTRVGVLIISASSVATSSLAVSMWSSVVILAVTEFLDFSLEGGDQSKEFFSGRGLLPISHSCKREQNKEKRWDKLLRLGPTVGANVLF
ncbi:hypothetical protein PIB30_025951 [Stylosanthes scabra]|uniref:Uncharacterized protein n=1 Tax=Stylosanthes scabra TaxID=79078 RepID=A0ABU6RAH5_9FABA|nr:hypothetical protein [Stylosanthes scabra]